MTSNDQYLVDVIGFNPVERSMLASIFALAARRDPGFVQYDPATTGAGSPDLVIVDADDAEAMVLFKGLLAKRKLPAVLVGSAPAAAGQTVLARPLQWARLLQALEDMVIGPDGQQLVAPSSRVPEDSALGRSLAGTRPGSQRPPGQTSAGGDRRPARDTVLVVDDNATVRAFMKNKLAPFHFEVDFAETGEEAVGMTGNKDYTCVFLDVVLPGIDGYQVCKLIKANKQAVRKTAVVMLTSRSSPFDKLRGSLAGCDEYLTKPLDEDRLLEVIAQFLPSSRKRERSGSK